MLARQPEAQIILRQQDLGDTSESRGFVLGHPDELGRREAGKDDVARDRAKPRIVVERCGLRVGAGVVP